MNGVVSHLSNFVLDFTMRTGPNSVIFSGKLNSYIGLPYVAAEKPPQKEKYVQFTARDFIWGKSTCLDSKAEESLVLKLGLESCRYWHFKLISFKY